MKQLICLLLLATLNYCKAQQIATEIALEVTATNYTEVNNEIKITTSNSKIFYGKNFVTSEITAQNKKQFTNIKFLDQGIKSYNYFTNNDTNFIYKDEAANDKIFNLPYFNLTNTNIQLVNGDTIIDNINCKKAFLWAINQQDTQVVNIWYNPLIQFKPEVFNYTFKQLPGLPVITKYIVKSSKTNLKAREVYYKHLVLQNIEAKRIVANETDAVKANSTQFYQFQGYTIFSRSPIISTKIIKGKLITSTTLTVNDTIKKPTGTLLNNLQYTPNQPTKLYVINFWFIHCKPCVQEIPDLNKLAKAFKDQPVAFVALTFDTNDDVAAFLKTTPFNFTHIVNKNINAGLAQW